MVIVSGKGVRGTFGSFAELVRRMQRSSTPRLVLKRFINQQCGVFGQDNKRSGYSDADAEGRGFLVETTFLLPKVYKLEKVLTPFASRCIH